MQKLHDKNIGRAVIYWLLTFGYMGLIFYLSSRHSIKLPKLANVDKIAHVFAYIPMAFLFFLSLNESGVKKYVFWIAFLSACLYGITDEIHQYFVPGRYSEIGDVIADSVGALIGCLAANYTKLKINLI